MINLNKLIVIFILLTILVSFILIKNNNEKYEFLDIKHSLIIKGLATLLILILHVGNYSGMAIFTPLGGIGVSMFLFVSGYGSYKTFKKHKFKNYWYRRYGRILLAFWIVILCDSLIKNEYAQLTSLLLINVPKVFWFISYVMFMYLLFYILFSNFNEEKSIFLMFLFSLCSLLFISDNLYAEQSFSFLCGVICSKYSSIYIKIKENYSVAITMIILGCMVLILKQTDFIRNVHYIIYSIDNIIIKEFIAIGMIILLYKFRGILFNSMIPYYRKMFLEICLTQMCLLCFLQEISIKGVITFTFLLAIFSYLFFTLVNKIANIQFKKEGIL